MVSLAWLLVPMAKASGIVTILIGEDSPRIQRVCRNAPRKAGPTRSLLWLSITENDRQHGRTLILLNDDCRRVQQLRCCSLLPADERILAALYC